LNFKNPHPMILNYNHFKKQKMEKKYVILGMIDGKIQNYIWHYFKTALAEEAQAILDGAKVNINRGNDRDAQELILFELTEVRKLKV